MSALVREARANGSDALVVVQGERTLAEHWYSESHAPIQTMSITKSVLSLAAGCLVDVGKLSLDWPVSRFYPAWQQGDKARVTVRQLLTHSSGLDENRDTTAPIYASRDFVAHALTTPLASEPGTKFQYNNRGANLLSGVIAKAANEPTERVVQRCLFEPLGIGARPWSRDRAGQVHGLAGLHLLPEDLVKLGQLVLGEGQYGGRRVLSREWIRLSTQKLAEVQPPNRRLALMWWLLPRKSERYIDAALLEEWRKDGVPGELIETVRPLVDRRFDSTLSFVGALRERFGDPDLEEFERVIYDAHRTDVRWTHGPIVGVYAEGSLGQYLVIVPEHRLLAVRLRRRPKAKKDRDSVEQRFPDFPARVLALVEAPSREEPR